MKIFNKLIDHCIGKISMRLTVCIEGCKTVMSYVVKPYVKQNIPYEGGKYRIKLTLQ